MKKRFLTLILSITSILMCIFGLTACGNKEISFKLNFVVDDTVYATIDTSGDEVIALPENPTKEEYSFDGWFWDKDVWNKPFTANSLLDAPLSSDMSVYAKFSLIHNCDFKEKVASDIYKATDATCENKATYYFSCYCGEMGTETFESGVAQGHSFTNYISDNNATCEVDGTKTAVCNRNGCNKTDTITDVNSKLGHSFTNYISDNNATTTNDGTKTAYCNYGCGTSHSIIEENTKLKVKLTIDYANGKENKVIEQYYNTQIEDIEIPTKPGYGFVGWDKTLPTVMPKDDLTLTAKWEAIFTLQGTAITRLTNYGKTLSEIKIPESIDGVDIVSIGTYAFYGAYSLMKVEMSDKILVINSNAFSVCSLLKEVVFSNNLITIGSYAFSDCSLLNTIELPNSIQNISKDSFRNTSIKNATIPLLALTAIVESSKDNYYSNSTLESVIFADGEEIKGLTGCYSLKSVKLPNNVKSIGDSAFYNCLSLTSIEIPSSVTSIGSSAFYNCSSLTSVVIPDSVTSIGSSAFYSCDSLLSITLPFVGASLNGTSNMHFGYIFGASSSSYNDSCVPTSLKEIIITGGASIGEDAFAWCDSITSVVIPNSVTSIGDWAFNNCMSLTSVVIGDSVTSIGSSAFSDCYSLTSVVIPDSVTSIGSSAFAFCDSITSVEIPDSVTSIGNDAFYRCTSLTSVEIPDSVTSIGCQAFYKCTSLTSITLPFVGASLNGTSNMHFGYIFGASSYPYNDDYVPTSLKEVIITGGASIGNYAFAYCASLTSVVIPNSVTSIGKYAFLSCTSLTSVVIPNSVTSIGEYAFYNCKSLTSVLIGDSVTSIGEYAFRDCTRLTSVNYNGTKEEWGNIEKGFSWDAYSPIATVYCTDGEIKI